MTMDNTLLEELTTSINSLLSLLEASIASVSDTSTITPPSQGWNTTNNKVAATASMCAPPSSSTAALNNVGEFSRGGGSSSFSASCSSSSSLSTGSHVQFMQRPRSTLHPAQQQQQVMKPERRSGYEIRRATRRLERAIQCLSKKLENYYYHTHHEDDDTPKNNNTNSMIDDNPFNYFCSMVESSQDDLIRIITILPRVLEESFQSCTNGNGVSDGGGLMSHQQHDVMLLFDKTACEACRILMRYYYRGGMEGNGGNNAPTDYNDNCDMHNGELQRQQNQQQPLRRPKPLPLHQLSNLLDRIATILFRKQNDATRHGSSWLSLTPSQNNNNYEPLELQHILLVSIVNQNLALMEQAHDHHYEYGDDNISTCWSPPEEIMQLIQLLLPHCMNDLSKRWDAPKLHHHHHHDDSSLSTEADDGPIQLRIFVENMVRHLSKLYQQYKENEVYSSDRGDGVPQKVAALSCKEWLNQTIAAAAESNIHQEIIHKKVLHFIDACQEYGIEIVEHALDVLDGAKVFLGTLIATPITEAASGAGGQGTEGDEGGTHHPNGATIENQHHLCQLVLSDILNHTAIALHTVLALKQELDIVIPLRSLFVTFTNIVASTCHEAFVFLGQTQGGSGHFQTAYNEILVQMARMVVKDEILQKESEENMSSSAIGSNKLVDLSLENAIAIALTKDLELHPDAGSINTNNNHDSLTDQISKCFSANTQAEHLGHCTPVQHHPIKKSKTGNLEQTATPKCNRLSPEFLQVIQATTMASFILPNSHDMLSGFDNDGGGGGGGDLMFPSPFNKRQEMYHSMQFLYDQLKQNSSDATALLDPWQSLISRKVSEEGLFHSPSVKERFCDNHD